MGLKMLTELELELELQTATTSRSSSLTAPYFLYRSFFIIIIHSRGSLEAIKFSDSPNFKII